MNRDTMLDLMLVLIAAARKADVTPADTVYVCGMFYGMVAGAMIDNGEDQKTVMMELEEKFNQGMRHGLHSDTPSFVMRRDNLPTTH